ncbi:MAG: hypothetical protein PHS80_03130 [Methanothrix sp.]|nr:hypothetical protein [Methanothrix sp.]MDD4447462.1 hypothetical protein [Methanothrix sp.]
MNDAVLCARIDALKHNLEGALQCQNLFKEDMSKNIYQHISWKIMLFALLDGTIGVEATKYISELKNIHETISKHGSDNIILCQAWANYYNIYNNSQKIFLECLELIGSIAIRNYRLDSNIYKIADELIKNCSLNCTGDLWYSIVVPAHQESKEKTKTSIIRHRFPDWSIWSIPILVREFGNILLDHKKFETFFNEEIEYITRMGKSAYQKGDQNMPRWKVENYFRAIFSDAFATYFMGPAYAFSTIFQRLNPCSCNLEDYHPTDKERAYVIIFMLKMLNKEEIKNGINSPYEKIIETLEEKWNSFINEVDPQEGFYREDVLNKIVNDICIQLGNALRTPARYPSTGEFDGWGIAQNWYIEWEKQLRKDGMSGKILITNKVYPNSKLRDVFNAAWLCRVNNPEYVKIIADAAMQLSEKIINQQEHFGQNLGQSELE